MRNNTNLGIFNISATKLNVTVKNSQDVFAPIFLLIFCNLLLLYELPRRLYRFKRAMISPEIMKIIPVNFNTEHKKMLSHLHVMVNKQYLAIPSEYEKLITSLRTAYATEYSLNKEQTSYNDLLDALRLSLIGYQIE